MTQTILVTGATGNVGGAVVDLFPQDQRQHLRIGVRKPEKARGQFGDDLQYVAFDFQQADTFAGALTGIQRVFLVRPPQLANAQRDFAPFIDAMRAHDVQQVVFLSLQGVEDNSIVPHHKIEVLLKQSGIPYTFLRAGFFMQNLDTTHREDIQQRDDIFIPAGKAKTSFIDVRDIAECGIVALTQGGHENQAYTLTGAEALDYYEVAEIMSAELGRTITYSNPSILRFFWTFWRRGMSPMYVLVITLLYVNTRRGMAATVSDDYPRVVGKAQRTMAEYVHDYRDCWLR
jgi:uncharacterized protein YbjT (DUF2867 family)